ncbi:MAG TPA: NACHT domain-containing protein, partial [Galbitalea sp.]|nr:NACHT domain-containing protein [Galbitalea sp.]
MPDSHEPEAAPSAPARAAAGALGGAANEAGSYLRARVGALLALTIMEGTAVTRAGLALPDARGTSISAETDDPVDDLVVDLAAGGRIFIQVKLQAGLGLAKGSATDKAVKQFAKAVRSGLGSDDWLVLATKSPSAELKALGEFLDRSRLSRSGAATERELSGRAKLSEIASRYLSDAQVQELFDHLVIWQTDPTQGDGEAALSGLAATFVEPEHAGAASNSLTETIRTIARKRGGLDRLALVESLRRAVPLRPATDPQSAAAQATALANHRDREVRNGTTLRLFGAPSALADLRLADADARTYVLHGDARSGDPLHRILRRLGRMLLVGEAGGGKSTALAAMSAHWAERTAWPVPIRAHLKRLATAEHGIADGILDSATEVVVGVEREALRTVLADKINTGEALFILDGVDEIGESRVNLLEELRTWLTNLHEGNGVLIATRPSTAQDAQTLSLPQARLLAPNHPRQTANVIIETAAPDDLRIRDEWINSRRGWLTQAFERDPSLERTPLMVVTLAVIAVTSKSAEQLPLGRSQILKRSLFDAVRRWDLEQRARGDPELGSLEGSQARNAITGALIEMCKASVERQDATETQVHDQLVSLFSDDFGLRPGQARSAADDALEFWVNTGLFSFDGGSLTARTRPLAEAGVAVSLEAATTERANAWVDWARADASRADVLALAAGLSPEIAHEWIGRFGLDGTAIELINLADAFNDGVTTNPDDLQIVLARALALRAQQDEAERVTEAIVALPLAADERQNLRESLLDELPANRRLLIDALMVTQWDEQGARADDTLRSLISQVVPDSDDGPSRGEDGVIRIESSYVDGPYVDVYEAAAKRLVSLGRADAELVVAHKFAGSLAHHSAVLNALRAAGYDDLAKRFEAHWSRSFRSYTDFFDRADFRDETLRAL